MKSADSLWLAQLHREQHLLQDLVFLNAVPEQVLAMTLPTPFRHVRLSLTLTAPSNPHHQLQNSMHTHWHNDIPLPLLNHNPNPNPLNPCILFDLPQQSLAWPAKKRKRMSSIQSPLQPPILHPTPPAKASPASCPGARKTRKQKASGKVVWLEENEPEWSSTEVIRNELESNYGRWIEFITNIYIFGVFLLSIYYYYYYFLRLAYLYGSCALWWVVCLLRDLDTPLHAWRVRLQKGIRRFKIARSEAKGLASLACVIKFLRQ